MTANTAYVHDQMKGIRRLLRFLMGNIAFRFLAKIDSVEGGENIPERGAGIIYMNHTSLIDSVTVVNSVKRDVVPVARFDFGNTPIWGIFPKLWGVIPIKRGAVDRGALEQAVRVLESGELLLYLPEGTRRPAMGRAKDGMAYLAAQTGVPVIPAAVHGVEGFPSLSPKRWAQPGVQIRIGKPFRFHLPDGKVPREWLRKMTDEAMYRLAAMLPPERRGVYGDLALATTETIEPPAP
jgi:1-acyl-sn-glycerol-3-phosphate acyltransferase